MRRQTGAISEMLVDFAVACLRAMPFRPKMIFASLVGRMLFLLWRSRRADAVYWSSRAIGLPLDDPETVATARRSFANFAKFSMDFVDSAVLPRRQRVAAKLRQMENKEVLENAAKDPRGCLLVSAHIGNWELLGSWVSLLGRDLYVVALPLPANSLNKLAIEVRENAGMGLIDTSGAASGILRALTRGDWVAILADRPVSERGERVEFLGRRDHHPIGAVRLAKRARVPIVVGACWSDGSGGYYGKLFDAIETDDPAVTAEDAMSAALRHVESVIRQLPDQWYIAYTSNPSEDDAN
ncbi:MAG: lysophospholipid acyltransferase family protein [Chloroflexi bacterium]|nr:lysophospholipid acyltransferase family protein [Chloroflexota bacterium]MCY3938893.1 lysophospholipid acyltransferase family protein [Chloroflexota bacterium]